MKKRQHPIGRFAKKKIVEDLTPYNCYQFDWTTVKLLPQRATTKLRLFLASTFRVVMVESRLIFFVLLAAALSWSPISNILPYIYLGFDAITYLILDISGAVTYTFESKLPLT
jgi:hypothetical protein